MIYRITRPFLLLVLSALIATAGLLPTAQAAGGDLDPTFAPAFLADDYPFLIVRQSTGKLIVSGNFEVVNSLGTRKLLRLNPDGSEDTSFNVPAIAREADISALAIQPDDAIVIGGTFTAVNGTPRQSLARLNSEGALDPDLSLSFADDGPSGTPFITKLLVRPDGTLIVAGRFTSVNGVAHLNLVRLLPNGSRDATFNASTDQSPRTLAAYPDNSLLVGGLFSLVNGAPSKGLVRLDPQGALVSTTVFSPGLNVLRADDLAIQPDGNILVAGIMTSGTGIEVRGPVRLLPNGGLDPSFAPDIRAANRANPPNRVALHTEGTILVGGKQMRVDGTLQPVLTRLTSAGRRDPGFALRGFLDDSVQTILVQPDGKIILTGSFTTLNDQTVPFIARLLPTATLTTATPTATTTPPPASPTATNAPIPSATFTALPGPSATALPSATFTALPGASATPTLRPTTPVASATPTRRPSSTPQATPGASSRLYLPFVRK